MQSSRNRKSVLGDNPFSSTSTARSESGTPRAPHAGNNASKARSSAARAKGEPATGAKSEGTQTKPEARSPKAPHVRSPQPEERAATLEEATVSVPEGPAVQASQEPDGLGKKREVEQRIRDLDSMPEVSSEAGTHDGSLAQDTQRRSSPSRRKAQEQSATEGDRSMLGAAKELLSSDYYFRQWGRIGMRNRSEKVDEFGFDPKYDQRVRPALEFLLTHYFRATVEGIENVPAQGRALIVVNHSGTFPYDGVMLKTAIAKEHPSQRHVRWLSEDQVFYLPFVGSFVNRLGSVRACQENAERLLMNDNLVAVFPEGAKGMGRLYRDRYKLQRFGRGGFIRLCLRTGTPIIPCVIVGAEESMPLLFRIEYLTGPLGLPYLPITPTFPLLGPLGLLPAPTRWSFGFGPALAMDGYGPDSADDQVLVGRLTERVRATMQGMIDHTLASRRSVWLG